MEFRIDYIRSGNLRKLYTLIPILNDVSKECTNNEGASSQQILNLINSVKINKINRRIFEQIKGKTVSKFNV